MKVRKILVESQYGAQVTYSSATNASRALSGTGSTGKAATITRRCNDGGGYIGNTWVQFAK